MSGGCLNDSGYSLGRCDVQETKNIQSDSFSLAYYFFSQLPRIGQNVPYFGLSVGCLEGVWEVSGGCLSDSGYCLGRYDMQAIDNHAIRFICITVFLFSQLPWIGQNCHILGCL